jgi:hypothetical protein
VTILCDAKLAPSGVVTVRPLKESWSVERVARALHLSETTADKGHTC